MSLVSYKIPKNEQTDDRKKLFENIPGHKLGTINEKYIILSFGGLEFVTIPKTWLNNLNQ